MPRTAIGMLRRFDSWRKDPALQLLAREFLARHDANMAIWLAEWQQGELPEGGGEPSETARRGVSYLQLFDAISLWLCCAERHEPWRAQLLEGEGWTFSPVGGGAENRQQVKIEPWPLSAPLCDLAVHGTLVPRAKYASTDELLAATIASRVAVSWSLVP